MPQPLAYRLFCTFTLRELVARPTRFTAIAEYGPLWRHREAEFICSVHRLSMKPDSRGKLRHINLTAIASEQLTYPVILVDSEGSLTVEEADVGLRKPLHAAFEKNCPTLTHSGGHRIEGFSE